MTHQRKPVWCAAGTKVDAPCPNRALPGGSFCGTHFNMALEYDPAKCSARLAKGGQCTRKPLPRHILCGWHWNAWARRRLLMHPGAPDAPGIAR